LGILILLSTSCSFPGVEGSGLLGPGPVRPTVKIGLVAPFEGRYRYVGYDVIYAVRLALREVNQDGGVAGYGVELVAYDDGGNPALAADQARKLDVDPDVVGALGHFREPATAAALDAYAQAGLPLVVPTGLGAAVRRQGVSRALAPSVDRLAALLLQRAAPQAEGGAVLLAVDGRDGPLGRALQQAAQDQGLPLTLVSADADDWRERALAADPAVLLTDLEPVKAGEVVSALRQEGWAGAVLGGPALAAADFAAVAGAAAAGATFVTPWAFPMDVPEGDAFVAAYSEVSNGTPPGPLALPAYEAAWLLLASLERAAQDGIPTRSGVTAALFSLDRESVSPKLAPPQGPSEESFYWYRIGPDGAPERLR
jgi:branched-chain amino acid transport system substrate-binding protein